jgi:CHRD domain
MFLRNLAFGAAVSLAAVSLSQPARAVTYTFYATLSGSVESPPIASPATGFASVIVDDAAETMNVHVTFSGLSGPTTASHIHCCVAAPGNVGVATQVPSFSLFPLGVTSGTFDHTFDLTSSTTFNPAFVTANGGTVAGAETALLAGLLAGEAYLNIHTTFAPGGEIRGFFVTPLPGALPLFATGLGALGLLGWRRKRKQTAA